MEQPEAIARALSYGARMNGRRIVLGGMDKNVDILSQVGYISLSVRSEACDFRLRQPFRCGREYGVNN
jgi:hypothetical protein